MSRAPTDGGATDALRPVVDGIVDRAGFVLDDLEVRPAGQRLLVRVTLDAAEAPAVDDDPAGGVDLDAVAGVSREVSTALDEGDGPGGVLDRPWTLEVTTPGTDRPLTRPHHWRRAWLRRVELRLVDGSELTARVGAVRDPDGAAAVTVDTGGTLRTVRLDEVDRAVVAVEFRPAPTDEVERLRSDRHEAGGAGSV